MLKLHFIPTTTRTIPDNIFMPNKKSIFDITIMRNKTRLNLKPINKTNLLIHNIKTDLFRTD